MGVRPGGREATTGFIIKGLLIQGQLGLSPTEEIWTMDQGQSGLGLSNVPTNGQGSWGNYPHLPSVLFGSCSQQDFLPGTLAGPTLERGGLRQSGKTLGQSHKGGGPRELQGLVQ